MNYLPKSLYALALHLCFKVVISKCRNYSVICMFTHVLNNSYAILEKIKNLDDSNKGSCTINIGYRPNQFKHFCILTHEGHLPINSFPPQFNQSLIFAVVISRVRVIPISLFLFDLMANWSIPRSILIFFIRSLLIDKLSLITEILYKISNLIANSTIEINGKFMEHGFLKRLFYVYVQQLLETISMKSCIKQNLTTLYSVSI